MGILVKRTKNRIKDFFQIEAASGIVLADFT